MRHCLYLSVITLALVGCGHIPPKAHQEISQPELAYISKGALPQNTYRLYLCQGKRYTKLSNGEVSESWSQPRNAQVAIYDDAIKIAVLNDDEVAVLDFSKQKTLRYEWQFEITGVKLAEGEVKLEPSNAAYSRNMKIASQKLDRVFTVVDSGTVIAGAGGAISSFGGQYGYSYPMPISSSEKFCESKRIVFYQKMN